MKRALTAEEAVAVYLSARETVGADVAACVVATVAEAVKPKPVKLTAAQKAALVFIADLGATGAYQTNLYGRGWALPGAVLQSLTKRGLLVRTYERGRGFTADGKRQPNFVEYRLTEAGRAAVAT